MNANQSNRKKERHFAIGKLLIGFINKIVRGDVTRKGLKINRVLNTGAEIAQIKSVVSKTSCET